MPKHPVRLPLVVALLTLAPPALAQPVNAQPVNARPGLWEILTTLHASGTLLDPEALSRLPPGARAQAEAAIAAIQRPRINRKCLTAARLAEGFKFTPTTDQTCRQRHYETTATDIDAAYACTNSADEDTTVHAHFSFTTPTQMSGDFQAVTDTPRGGRRIFGQVQSHWVGAECGDVQAE